MKGIKRCRSWERSYALDTPYPHVNTCTATPHHPAHLPTLRAPTYTHARCNQRIPAVSDATNACHQRMPTTYPYHISLQYGIHPLPVQPTYVCNVSLQHIPTTYTCDISLRHISTTYPQYISLQHIPNTYPYDISLTHIPIIYLQS